MGPRSPCITTPGWSCQPRDPAGSRETGSRRHGRAVSYVDYGVFETGPSGNVTASTHHQDRPAGGWEPAGERPGFRHGLHSTNFNIGDDSVAWFAADAGALWRPVPALSFGFSYTTCPGLREPGLPRSSRGGALDLKIRRTTLCWRPSPRTGARRRGQDRHRMEHVLYKAFAFRMGYNHPLDAGETIGFSNLNFGGGSGSANGAWITRTILSATWAARII